MDFELTEEQRMLKEMVRKLGEKELKPRAREWDEKEEYPAENVKKLAQLGLLGITIPKEYGGGGLGVFEWILVIEEVAQHCGNTALVIVGHGGEPCFIISRFGSEEVKKKYLPSMASGRILAANALTEPEAGTALTDLTTTAILDRDHYIVNGRKCFTSRATVSDVFLTFVRFDPKVRGAKGIGAILVDKGTKGFSVGKVEKKLGFRGIPSADLIFEDCRVPKENLIFGEGGFGRLMGVWNNQRCGNGAACLGTAQAALDEAIKYSKERKQFGHDLCEFQAIQCMLADMAIKVEASRALLYRAAIKADKGGGNILDSAIAKTYANEIAFEVANAAIQILGGYGFTRDFPVERMMRDVRGLSIAGGTTQILRVMIASQLLDRKISQR